MGDVTWIFAQVPVFDIFLLFHISNIIIVSCSGELKWSWYSIDWVWIKWTSQCHFDYNNITVGCDNWWSWRGWQKLDSHQRRRVGSKNKCYIVMILLIKVRSHPGSPFIGILAPVPTTDLRLAGCGKKVLPLPDVIITISVAYTRLSPFNNNYSFQSEKLLAAIK